MNDVVVQFARLWGQKEATAISAKDEDISDTLTEYDSEELLKILTEWASEYLNGDYDDTDDFFEEKMEAFLG